MKHQIKEICKNFVYTLFADEKDEVEKTVAKYGYLTYEKFKTLGGEIKDRVIKTALEKFNEQYKVKVEEFIASEEFIDKIIERICKKQLN